MAKRTTAQKRAAFRALHQTGSFLLPNPWDVGSAKLFAHQGFQALASTSAGLAWTLGKADYAITKDEVLGHLTALSAATDLPLNADFESGFADDPERVADNVKLAIQTGISGLSIEDRMVSDTSKLFDTKAAAVRVTAAKEAIATSGYDLVLVARTERLLIEPTAVSEAIDALVAFAAAGADCLYAPGVAGRANIEAMVKAVAPKPVNVLAMSPSFPGLSIAEMAHIGVRRISVGGALSLVSWAAAEHAGEMLLSGSLDTLSDGMPRANLNAIFAT